MDDPVLEEEPKCTESRRGSTATRPSRKQTSSASSKVSGDLSSHVGHARRTSSARRSRSELPAGSRLNSAVGAGNGRGSNPRPSVRSSHSMTGRAGAGPLSDRHPASSRSASSGVPSMPRLPACAFASSSRAPAPCDSASTWPIASVMPRSTSQRNMAVQRSVCRVEEIATDPRPIPSTAVTRQFTRRGRAWSPTSTISRDESSATSSTPRAGPAPGSSHGSASTLEALRTLSSLPSRIFWTASAASRVSASPRLPEVVAS